MPDFDEHMPEIMPADGRYQFENLKTAVRYCKTRRTVIDGGAHIGTWAKVFAEMFGRVIAFEPSADTFECLRHNVQAKNVEFRQQAIGRKPGRVRMTLEGFDGTLREKNAGSRYAVEGGDVERIAIDSLDLADLDLLKMDIEGSEVDALHGAKETLKRCRPVVLFENKAEWLRHGYKVKAPQIFLTKLGAVKFKRVGMDEVWGWR